MKKRIQYSDELADKICDAISISPFGLHTICKENADFPSVSALMSWLSDGKHPYLMERYAHAKKLQAEMMAESIIRIAYDDKDDILRAKIVKNSDGSMMELIEENKEFVNRSRLKIDTLKWIMAKLYPAKYGEKIEINDVTPQKDRVVIFKHENADLLKQKEE